MTENSDASNFDYLRNRDAWDRGSDEYQARHREQLSNAPEAWGVWSLPEAELRLIGEVAGLDVLEYGCGAAEWSIALAKRGARCIGLDNSARQLEHARRNVEHYGSDVRLVHAPAERTELPDRSFDVVFCDHGAMSFADPRLTIPEVARLLRPGGIFAFSREHPIHATMWDDASGALSNSARRPYFDLARSVDPEDGGVGFGGTIEFFVTLLIEHGFVIERLLEPRPPIGASSTYDFASLQWARELPSELMLRARKT